MKLLTKKQFFAGVLFIGGLFALDYAKADTVTLSWQPPTTRVDGSALDAKLISGYNIQYQGKWLEFTPLTTKTYTVGPGKHCYAVNTVLVGDIKSDYSDKKCKTVVSSAKPALVELKVK